MMALQRLALCLIMLVLLGCSGAKKPDFQSTDITGANFGGPFTLTDQNGKPRALADFKGKIVVLFFGYTHCPDVCPTTMSELATSMKALGAKAKDVQVLFITVDPDRDTQAVLAQYIPAFNSDFVGLRGNEAETKAVADAYKIFYQKVPGSGANNYSVDHSAGSYILDKTGALRLFVNYGAGSAAFTHDLTLLLDS